MKNIFFLGLLSALWLTSHAQDSKEKVMENRAREMLRVIGLNDKEQWKKFIKENYTQTLIDKPMKAQIQSPDGGSTSLTDGKPGDNLEAKAKIFARLHDDFGNSKITSIKPNGENLEMILEGENGLTGRFHLKFDKNKPYLIDGMSIEAGD